MGKTPRGLLFLLLVTISIVKAEDFAYSKRAYKATLSSDRLNFGVSYTKEYIPVEFDNMDTEQILKKHSVEDQKPGIPQGLYLLARNRRRPIDTILQLAHAENQKHQPEYFVQMSIVCRRIPHVTGKTTVGFLLITFVENEPPENAHHSYLRTHMFSAPKNADVQLDANKVVILNPLSESQVTNIATQKRIRWKLSSLQGALSSGVRKSINPAPQTETVYALKPIIVDENLLRRYCELAHPNGDIPTQTVEFPNPVRFLQRRETGGRRRWKTLELS